MRVLRLIVIVSAILIFAAHSFGAVLWSDSIQDQVTYQSQPVSGIFSFSLYYSAAYEFPDPIAATVVDWSNINVANYVGQTIYRDASNDPQFNTFVAYLTNGINNHFREQRTDGAQGEYESLYFNFTPNGIDFEGYAIQSVSLTIDSYSSSSIHDYTLAYTYAINGVPEPVTLTYLGLGLLLIRKRKLA